MTQLALIPKQDLVRPPEPEEFHADMTMLLSAFPSQQRQEPAQVIATYMIALEGYSAAAIHAGILKFIRGEWPGHDAVWLPSPGMVGRAVKAAADDIKNQIEAEKGRALRERFQAREREKQRIEAEKEKRIEMERAARTPAQQAAFDEKVRNILRNIGGKPDAVDELKQKRVLSDD